MPSLSLKAKFGGGSSVPIRGIQEFSSDTPVDYTVASGERYIKNGSVETDSGQFDLGIWDQTWGIVTNRDQTAVLLSVGSNDTHAHMANYSATSNEVLIGNGAGVAKSLISVDGGDTYALTDTLPNAILHIDSTTPIHSVGTWVIPSLSSVDVMRTTNSGVSWLTQSTGLAGNIFGLMGDETNLYAWSNSGVGRKSTDGGSSWSDAAGATHDNTHNYWAMIGSDWYIFDTSSLTVSKSTDSGANWTDHASSLKTTTALVWTDGIKLYQQAASSEFPVVLWESLDGLLWTDSGISLDLEGSTSELEITLGFKVIRIGDLWVAALSAASSGAAYFSKDGINWKPYTNSAEGEGISLSYRAGGKATLFNANFSIDTIENIPFAGDYEVSIDSQGQQLKWTRII